jgi:hypothetical protein
MIVWYHKGNYLSRKIFAGVAIACYCYISVANIQPEAPLLNISKLMYSNK